MTTTSPLPPHAPNPYGPPAGWAPVPTPYAVQQGYAPVERSRLSPGQVWTLVVAAVFSLVVTVTAIAVGESGDSGQESVSGFSEDGGDYYGDYYGEYYEDSDCYDAFC